jgi:hypothetical protein
MRPRWSGVRCARKGCLRSPHSNRPLRGARWLIRSSRTGCWCATRSAAGPGSAHTATGSVVSASRRCRLGRPPLGGAVWLMRPRHRCLHRATDHKSASRARGDTVGPAPPRAASTGCVQPVDEAVNADESRTRPSRLVVAAALPVRS